MTVLTSRVAAPLFFALASVSTWAQSPVFEMTQKAEVLVTPRSPANPTKLLFPFVNASAASGTDTEITISNTSLDALGSTAQAGVCVLNFYGGTTSASGSTGAAPPAATTASIAPGKQLVFHLSQGGAGIPAAPGFQGFVLANCSFPLARGLAKIISASSAYSQEGQVLTSPRSTSIPQYLLFPFISNSSVLGADTAISIANTSLIDSPSTIGTCDIYPEGLATASNGTTYSLSPLMGCDLLRNPLPGLNCFPVVSPGSVQSVLASSVFPNYEGNVIASCRFTGATGFAAVGSSSAAGGAALSETPESLAAPRSATVMPLLFSAVTNQNGWDTRIAIANTGKDPLGTAGSAGSCALNFYGTAGIAPVSTGTIAVGGTYTTLLSTVAPGFQGYVFASCSFPYARGTAYRTFGGNPDGHAEAAELVVTPRSLTPAPLLFPAVANWGGYDTDITISNTSQDSLGTASSSGTCSISYFGDMAGGGATPTIQTSGAIPPGGQLSFTLAKGNAAAGIGPTPGFRGYVIANCSFPLARGLATVMTATPSLNIVKTHLGDFSQGQANAAYSLTVSDRAGTAPTSGTVTVTESLPAGLLLVSMGGTGWTCLAGTCTRTDSLAAGASYPAITVTVNVSSSAPSQVTNQATVSGGGSVSATANDVTTIIGSSSPVPLISSILNAASEWTAIAQNTWVEIKGSNLAPRTRSWQASDFVANRLPTDLDGVSVTVNGKSAYVYYISPTQINVLTPLDSTLGAVPVQVTNNGVKSAVANLSLQTYAPGFFLYSASNYVAATHLDGSLLGPTSLYPGFTTPAYPGELVTLYGNGFGQTSPALVSGTATQAGALPLAPSVTIGGIPATVQFAGVSGAGLYSDQYLCSRRLGRRQCHRKGDPQWRSFQRRVPAGGRPAAGFSAVGCASFER